MKKKIIIILIVCAALIAGGLLISKVLKKDKQEEKFEFAAIKRGDLEEVISCTGTLSAVRTVNIGSQVSGITEKVFVDYNDNVKKGQLLAVLDKTLFQASVKDAEAGVARAKFQNEQAQAELKRNKPLYEKGHLSESEFLVTKTTAETAAASLRSAEATAVRARTQLDYTEIRSPIDGTIIKRTVENGQTIAASFQSPELFVIAQDLTKMRIEASVDESDIGQIKEGQSARFTVQAYPDETFTGQVSQIRLSPTIVQNVVNYTVVVEASNDKKLLLPGMTATVDFMIEEKRDILLIPNTALTFNPPEEMRAKLQQQMMERFKNLRQQRGSQGSQRAETGQNRSGIQGGSGGMGGFPGGGMMQQGGGMFGARKLNGSFARVYYLDEKGNLAMAFLEKGVTDGKNTEIKRSRDLKEGMKIITAYIGPKSKTATTQSGPPPMMFPMGGGRR